jgi:two-component system NtrC family response regulator
VVTAPHDRLDAAVSGMRAGADALVVTPLDAGQIALVAERALEARALRRERAALRRELREDLAVVGESAEVTAAVEVVARVGPTQATVLVQGEPGTGRTHFGTVIHEASPRRDGPLVRVSCAGVSVLLLESRLFGHEAGAFEGAEARHVGAIEQAEGGTLFLEEVQCLPVSTQVRLLRLLQSGELERLSGRSPIRADVRVVAAASGDLADEVRDGRFRADLYYRLAVVTLALPPLRARKADVPALAMYFLARHARRDGRGVDSISPGALSALFSHDWPGNVRELSAELEQAVPRAAGREIGAGDLSPVLRGAVSADVGALIPGASLFEIERDAILRTLERVGGSSVRAAEILGVSVRKIQYRLKEYRSGRRRRSVNGTLSVTSSLVDD